MLADYGIETDDATTALHAAHSEQYTYGRYLEVFLAVCRKAEEMLCLRRAGLRRCPAQVSCACLRSKDIISAN